MAESDEAAALRAEIEARTGGRVVYGYPAITRGGGWRATVRGGSIGLASVTLTPPTTQEAALQALLERIEP